MPTLDVTFVLDCPEFQTTFHVMRWVERVDTQGENTQTPAQIQNVPGVVVPTSHTTLRRLSDMANMQGSIEIYTKFRLTAGRGGLGADEILYNSANYTVMEVRDYTAFGAGFVHAVCQLKDVNPELPQYG